MRSWASWRSSSLPRLPVRPGTIEAVTLSIARMSAGRPGRPCAGAVELGETSLGPPWTLGPGRLVFFGFRRLLTGTVRSLSGEARERPYVSSGGEWTQTRLTGEARRRRV